ncbi:SRPBCC domain-containing protein [Methylobacter luteus]|uniref:SRPBCC domain-containing protein n=1 Tax=Methylobacter luteus TaxID=415 RepID=UPI0003F77C68|nr:SRPBCC domain-containing protein [Methylobacter luteus]
MSSYLLQTEIEIDATPAQIWAILTDFAAYPAWNPFIKYIHGIPRQGDRLEVRIQPGGAKGMTFRPAVLAADAGRELRWLGSFLLPGVFDGEHRFVIEPLASGKVLFRQSERFSGMLVPIFKGSLERDTKRGFEEMNRALKARAESKPQAG